jgi:Ca-activated chloride channel family protein
MNALAACTLVAISALTIAQRHAPQRFRSRAELVAVDVLVMDGRRPVAGLTAADFVLLDNGVPQTIEQLQVEALSLNILMVLDVSWSLRGERLEALKKAASAVVQRLRSQDRAALIAFSHRLELRSALTADRAQLHAAIASLAPDGSTALRDAAYAGIALRGTDPGRTLMLLFSDGVDTASFLDERRVLEAARRSDVTVYPIGVRDEPSLTQRDGRLWVRHASSAAPTDDRFLKALAEETGGRLVHAEGDRDLGPTFARVLDEFKTRYVIGYAPAGVAASGWHSVEVRMKNRKGTVTARRGYFAR